MKRIGILVAGALLVATFVIGSAWWLKTGSALPELDLSVFEFAVVERIQEARQEVFSHSRSGKAWGRLGMVLFAHQAVAEARFCFEEAIRLEPREPRWQHYLGMLLSLSDAQGAAAAYEKAVELWPLGEIASRIRLAEVLLTLGELDTASPVYQQVLKNEPRHPIARLRLSQIAFAKGELDACGELVEPLMQDRHTRKSARILLAGIWQRKSALDRAERERALAADLPDDVPWPDPLAEELAELRVDRLSRLKRASQFLERKLMREGLGQIAQIVRDEPDFDTAWRVLGFTLYELGQFADAERALSTALRLSPDSSETLYYLGCVYFAQGEHAVAKQYFLKATQLKPDYAIAYYNLGLCLKSSGDASGAAESFRSALRCRPYLTEAHRELGALLAESRNSAEAKRHLMQALELNPSDERCKALLSSLDNRIAPTPQK